MHAVSLTHIMGHQPRKILKEMAALGLQGSKTYLLSFLCIAFLL